MKKILLSLVALLGVAGTASAINAGDVVLSENWDKLYNAVDANGKNVFSLNPWTGADANGVSYQPNFTDLSKSEYLPLLNGWSSRSSYLYSCRGFVRISKTKFGGDLLSPALTALGNDTADLELNYQGIGYTSNIKFDESGTYKSGGVHDYQAYYVVVLGDGEITSGATKMQDKILYADADGNATYYKGAQIEIPTDAFINPLDTMEAWSNANTKVTLKIKGATAKTQIAFVASEYKTLPKKTDPEIDPNAPHGTNDKVCRVVLDNIKITVDRMVTAVDNVNAAKAVKHITYCNLQGQTSAEPFEGVNIVKTVYTDGSTHVAKVIK